ncbi:hypothetical protein BV22DRAFT_1134058 [Leucogyrophana mollusca]|uniref:Uncharacterized protein n=1 Tax=Leucogyrophana mollusca TaxID=85980 RepID=A0ACB8B0R8_9AGAM|nr:hypothetical protein BV22DRAFT_1134058 [Leucogyrophana mollusca]
MARWRTAGMGPRLTPSSNITIGHRLGIWFVINYALFISCVPVALIFYFSILTTAQPSQRASVTYKATLAAASVSVSAYYTFGLFLASIMDDCTASDVLVTLVERGLVPSGFHQSHYLTLPGIFGRRLSWDECLGASVPSLSHLYLRIRLPGGADITPPSTQQILVRPIVKWRKGRPSKNRQEDVYVISAGSSSQPTRLINQTSYSMGPAGRVSARNTAISITDSDATLNLNPELVMDTGYAGEPPQYGAVNDEDYAGVDLDADNAIPSKRKRTAGDQPLLNWIPDRGVYLDELLRHKGRGDSGHGGLCADCGSETSRYRCEDCFGEDVLCATCTVKRHATTPLHRLKEWTGNFFERVSLKSLGLRIQLGHSVGSICARPERAFGDAFVVVDIQGVHDVGLDFCGCETAKTRTKQLLRAHLFPSTSVDPKSAATFRVLEQFHLLSFESKVSAYEFYESLARRTDNTGLVATKDRYEPFMRMVREWRHLKMLKRAGRGHDPDGVDATKEGACAVLCPACPHPNKNLPDGWENVSLTKRWLYALFVAIDANFRLKRKFVSSDAADPGLSAGLAYFVPEKAYKAHLQTNTSYLQEKSTCASHNAVNMADTKSARGLAATGVGTIDCARHNMKLPNGVGDLQKGERYINMDYLFFSTLRGSPLRVLNVSYDIACQWHKKLWSRMQLLSPSFHVDIGNKVINFLVPKFHLPAHIPECQTAFSFNFMKGVGRTDGEAPERGWSNINPVASSTKEMGPGARRDTLDDHFGDWNWKKVVALGRTMLRKSNEALKESASQRLALQELEAALPEQDVKAWRIEVEAWENDQSQPNPYETKVETITQAAVRLQLAKDEAQELQEGRNPSVHVDVSPSVLIANGLDLEDQQRRLRELRNALGSHATDNQKTRVQQLSNALQRKIDAWASIQALYMPTVTILRSSSNVARGAKEPELPEDSKLWLPSEVRTTVVCDTRLQEYEWQLRFAQAGDALNDVRRYVRLESYLLRFKDRNLRGQGANTRARNTLAKIDLRKRGAADRYNGARGAMKTLSGILGKVSWGAMYQELARDDIRSIHDLLEGETEGRRTLSWIWKTAGILSRPDSDEGLQDALRVEWCKARARATRWSEEVELLMEEKRRILAFLTWHAGWWDKQAERRAFERIEEKEASVAYARRQAALRRSLAGRFSMNKDPIYGVIGVITHQSKSAE